MTERPHIGGRIASGLIAVLAAATVLTGVFAWDQATTRTNRPSGSIAELRDFQQLALNHPNQALAQCERSEPTLFSALAGALSDRDDEFGEDRFEYRKNGLTYLSANLLNADGDTKASTPVWVYGGAGYAALSRGAARFTTFLPDATDEYGANAQGLSATRVKTCVIAAGRAAALARNG